MPFETIYNYKKVTKELYYSLKRETGTYEMANRMWAELVEQYPQYEQYKMYVVPFWVGNLQFNPHRLWGLSVTEMAEQVEDIKSIIDAEKGKWVKAG